jgi:hypothetical protein
LGALGAGEGIAAFAVATAVPVDRGEEAGAP